MTELSLKIGNRTLVAREQSEDLTVTELFEMFKGLLVGHTYLESSIISTCKNYVEEA